MPVDLVEVDEDVREVLVDLLVESFICFLSRVVLHWREKQVKRKADYFSKVERCKENVSFILYCFVYVTIETRHREN